MTATGSKNKRKQAEATNGAKSQTAAQRPAQSAAAPSPFPPIRLAGLRALARSIPQRRYEAAT